MNYVTALGREEVVDFVTIVLKSVTVCVGGVGWGVGLGGNELSTIAGCHLWTTP